MKHVSGLLQKLTAFAAVVVALSSCNRAEYAMLPKTSSYHGTEHRAVSVKPAPAAEVAATPETVAPAAPAAEVAAAPASTTPVAAPAVAATKPAAPAPATAAPAKAPRKLNLVERALVSKVAKKADKLSSKMQLKKHSETASANKLSGKLRQGIILLLAGLLIEILGAATGIGLIYVLGAIVAIIGVVLIILYLLDEL